MEQKNSKIFNGEIMQAVSAFCSTNNIENIDDFNAQGTFLAENTMKKSQIVLFLRDTLAVMIVGVFLFPIFWWGLNSIKPASALFDKDGIVFFDFVPSFVNYWVTFSGDGPGVYDARRAIADTLIVALGSTILEIGRAHV